MINEVCRKIAEDLNVRKYEKETDCEYTQRVIFSASSVWVRTLIFGNNFEESADVYPDIMYVQSRLAKVINAYLHIMEVSIDWISKDDDNSNVAMKIAIDIIDEMIYTYNIGKVNERQLCHVPYEQIAYGDWIQIRGNSNFSKDIYSIGVSQWCKNKKEVEYKIEHKIINQNANTYITKLKEGLNWKTVTNLLTYNVFQVGFDRGYSKCWRPYIDSKSKDGFYLLKEQSQFNGGYLLLEKSNSILKVAVIDPWYIETREIYRIMYTLNYINRTPAKHKLYDYGEYSVLYLASALPDYENRILLSLSWPYRYFSDKYARIISNDNIQIIEKLISDIGAELVYKQKEKRWQK